MERETTADKPHCQLLFLFQLTTFNNFTLRKAFQSSSTFLYLYVVQFELQWTDLKFWLEILSMERGATDATPDCQRLTLSQLTHFYYSSIRAVFQSSSTLFYKTLLRTIQKSFFFLLLTTFPCFASLMYVHISLHTFIHSPNASFSISIFQFSSTRICPPQPTFRSNMPNGIVCSCVSLRAVSWTRRGGALSLLRRLLSALHNASREWTQWWIIHHWVHSLEALCNVDSPVDLFCGPGGNCVQFALHHATNLIGMEINADQLEMFQQNATVYEVHEKMEYIHRDAFSIGPQLARSRTVDSIFTSPLWGGLEYQQQKCFDFSVVKVAVELVLYITKAFVFWYHVT